MSARDLARFFDQHRDEDRLVLASVYDTLGSTYSKAGDRMLIAANGDFQGMLSGGCLEGDLAERAIQVASEGKAQSVTYDLREKDEELWGLGVGCEGLMRIFLQPLDAGRDYQPFPELMALLNGEQLGAAITVIASDDPATEAGATLIGTASSRENFGVSDGLEALATKAFDDTLAEGLSRHHVVRTEGGQVELLCAALSPVPRILVLGGGLDAEPVVRGAVNLGWHVTVQDHRPVYIEKGDFSGAGQVLCEPSETLADVVDLDRFDAAVVMSHHLVTDRTYLEQLAMSPVRYIGLLGPVHRRERLMQELGDKAARLAGRVHGPAGLPLGGRGPAPIALSILAEMHQALCAED